MPQGGWFAVARALTDPSHDLHPSSTGEAACSLAAWVDLLGQARWRDGSNLRRGEFRGGIRRYAERWNWSRSETHRFFRTLQEGERIEKVREPRGRRPAIYRIVNYESYQPNPENSLGRERVRKPGRNSGRTTPQRDKGSRHNGGTQAGTQPGTRTGRTHYIEEEESRAHAPEEEPKRGSLPAAREAWGEIQQALEDDSYSPLLEPLARRAFKEVGGWTRLEELRTDAELTRAKVDFQSAYIQLGEDGDG